jgi:hypothetical protein
MSPREGAALRLLTPSVLLPAQMASPWADRWLRRLCRAILEDALACLAGKGPSSNLGSSDSARRASQARQWFQSDATYLFSFATVCAVLDLEAEAVRRQVRQRTMKEQPDRYRGVRDKVKETTAAARETIARANAALDQTRQRLQELEESRQLHRAIAERQAGQRPAGSENSPPHRPGT